jgi:hypothetical protein
MKLRSLRAVKEGVLNSSLDSEIVGELRSSVLTQCDPVRLVLGFHSAIHLYNLTLAGKSIPGVTMGTTATSSILAEWENHTRIVSQLEMLLVVGWILVDPPHTLPRMVPS